MLRNGARHCGWVALLLAVLTSGTPPARGETLAQIAAVLDLDREHITLSGVSSGAYLAQQFHAAHSTRIAGVGLIAGGPYRCAEGSYPPWSWFDASGLYAATSVCSNTNPFWFFQGPPDVEFSVRETRRLAGRGAIDEATGLLDDRVWLLSGGEDDTVPRVVVEALERYYLAFVDAANLHHERLDEANHAMITDDFGNACGVSGSPFISDCNFDAAGALLAHLHGPLQPAAARADLLPVTAFEQSAFLDRGDASTSMSATAHVYVPTRCRAGQRCQLHVAFHGCRQTQAHIGDAFFTESGYNEWAEANAIVVLYPQATVWDGATFYGKARNPRGCWDWWGYSGSAYATRAGKQLRAVAAMIDTLLGAAVFAAPR